LLTGHLNAQQSRSSLENQRKELNRQIESVAKNLEKTSKLKKQEAQKLAVLQEKARSRTEKISEIRGELNSAKDKIEYNTIKIAECISELEKIKIAYKKILLLLYQSKTTFSLIDLIFAPEQFHKQYIRHYYLKKIQRSYFEKALKLKNEQVQFAEAIKTLKSNKEDKKQILKESKDDGELSDALEKQEKQFRELSMKESKIKKELEALEAEKKKLNIKIEQLIKEKIADSKNKSRTYESAKNR